MLRIWFGVAQTVGSFSLLAGVYFKVDRFVYLAVGFYAVATILLILDIEETIRRWRREENERRFKALNKFFGEDKK